MPEHTRTSGLWFYIADPEQKKQINVRLNAVRQEVAGPLSAPVTVVSFGSYTVPLKGEPVAPTEADKDKCEPFATSTGDSEIIMLFEASVGTNPALLFERIASIVTEVLLEKHRPMCYTSYRKYQTEQVNQGSSNLHAKCASSPTGFIGVWDVFFTRTYGLTDDGLFYILGSQATYRAGYVRDLNQDNGSLYDFPEGYKLSRQVSGADFLEVMSNLLAGCKDNGDLALVEAYRIR